MSEMRITPVLFSLVQKMTLHPGTEILFKIFAAPELGKERNLTLKVWGLIWEHNKTPLKI